MTTALTHGQHALLESTLKLAQQRAHTALQAQRGGSDRMVHAAALLAEEPHEHESDRELDQARENHLLVELQAIDDALMRLKTPGYGRCVDCAATIPFDRLQRQPQALRCIDCQAATEANR